MSLCSLVHGDEVRSTELDGILLLVISPGDGGNFGTHSLGEHDTKVTQTTNTDNTDLLDPLTPSLESFKGGVSGDTSTEHGSSGGEVQTIWNGNGKLSGSTPDVDESSFGLVTFTVSTEEGRRAEAGKSPGGFGTDLGVTCERGREEDDIS